MNNDYKSTAFKEWLDNLQRESWQLELIISGFAIYGLFQCIEPLEVETLIAIKNDQALYSFLLGPAATSVYILILILLTHVVLRGLWIGALGLRYISGDIDYDGLGYNKKFTSFLENKVGSFDRYIFKLENICSTLFALAFLMVFYFLSFFCVLGLFVLLVFFARKIDFITNLDNNLIKAIFPLLYFLCVLLLIIDFFGAGVLKKQKLISKIYFPIYRVFGFITLSFLYRPLVYNFLDQKKARWIAIFVVPLYLIITTIMSTFGMVNSNFQVFEQASSKIYINKNHYEDLLTDKTDFVQFVSIPSKVIEEPYLPVFIGFNDFMENAVLDSDSTLTPEHDKRGYGFGLSRAASSVGGAVSINIGGEILKKQEKYLSVLNKIYQLHIDNVVQDKDLVMTTNKRNRYGFETYLDLDSLSNGKHLLRLVGPEQKQDKSFEIDTLITIPFWYFKS